MEVTWSGEPLLLDEVELITFWGTHLSSVPGLHHRPPETRGQAHIRLLSRPPNLPLITSLGAAVQTQTAGAPHTVIRADSIPQRPGCHPAISFLLSPDEEKRIAD